MRAATAVALFLAGLLVGVGLSGRAAEWLVVSGIAVHLDGSDYCNERTDGLGIETASRYSVGFYRNSNCRWSWYAGKAWTPLKLGIVHLGGLVGAVTGYKHELTPLAAAYASLETRRWGVNVTYVPEVKDSGNVLWFQIKRRF